MTRRLPAEWEEQDGVLLAWPHGDTDWAGDLESVEPVFAAIAAAVTRFETAVVVGPEPGRIAACLRAAGARGDRVRVHAVATNDTWARDFGPVTVEAGGRPLLLDFGFNGWGGKFEAGLDDRATRVLAASGAFGSTPLETVRMVLEGGSIESDGRGTVLTTSRCLLAPTRNPHLDRQGIERALCLHLGTRRVLWLEAGQLAGDDTDAHVDTLARFAPGDTIVYQGCDDPADEHWDPLGAMAEELGGLRTEDGGPYRLVPLPWPRERRAPDGRRLPATYANFLAVNGAVLVPTYDDPADAGALAAVAAAFPGREVVGIDCSPVLLQHGSLHCLTMQLPRGVLP